MAEPQASHAPDAGPDADPELDLEAALERLRAVDADDPAALELAAARCLAARTEARNRFMIYRETGEALLERGRTDAAEAFAVRSLQALPRYGAALRLLGRVAEARGDDEEAAQCHRYRLPERVRRRWFGDVPLRRLELDAARAEVLDAHPAERHLLRAPWSADAEVPLELSARTLEAAPSEVVRLPGGRLWYDSFNTVVWDATGGVVAPLCRGYAEVVNGSLGEREPLRVRGRVALLGNRNARNYYHWMNDVLPRLAVLERAGVALDAIDFFLVDPLAHPFHAASLAAFGITEERLLTIDRVEYLEADELYVPVHGSNSLGLRQGAWNPRFLRERLGGMPAGDAAHARRADGAPGRRLWISRGTEGARAVRNEPEVLEAIAPLGFETVRCEALDIGAQARAFEGAATVLGPHGAGLSNIAFCRPGTLVVELFGTHIEPCFWTLAEVTGPAPRGAALHPPGAERRGGLPRQPRRPARRSARGGRGGAAGAAARGRGELKAREARSPPAALAPTVRHRSTAGARPSTWVIRIA